MNEWLKDIKQLNREQAEELYNIAILTITNKVKDLEQQLQAYKDKEDKLEEQTKTYQKILNEQQNEIDQLERNCDVFYEQMNDAVEITVELNKEKQDLKEWLEEEINKLNPKKLELGELNLILDDVKFYSYIQLTEVLERLG